MPHLARLAICLILFIAGSTHLNAQSPQERCDTLILQGIHAMKQQQHTKSLKLLAQAHQLAKTNGLHKQLFLALNNTGANYYKMLDFGAALENYLEAYEVAIAHLEMKYQMVVLNNVAILYAEDENFTKAQGYFEQAYALAKEMGNQSKMGVNGVNLAHSYNELNQPERAAQVLDEVFPYIEEISELWKEGVLVKSETQLLLHHPEEAKSLLLATIEQVSDSSDLKVQYLLLLSRVEQVNSRYEPARKYTDQALLLHPGPGYLSQIYRERSGIFAKQGRLQEALQDYEQLLLAEKESNLLKNGRQFENNRVKFEIQNYRQEIVDTTLALQHQRYQLYSFLGASVLIIGLLAWALNNNRLKISQQKQLTLKTQAIADLKLEKERKDKLLLENRLKEKETLAKLEEEKLKNAIESRNRELSTKTLYLSERSTLISSILKELTASLSYSPNSSSTVLKKQIKKLKDLMKTEDEWKNFTKHFEEVNHGFLSKLKEKHPDLLPNDIRFVCYLYMNLNTKEISQLLNITPDACRKRKERIARKMNIDEETTIYQALSVL